MKLLPQHRFQIPNSLAIFAALLLIASSVIGFETSQEAVSSGHQTTISAKANDNESINTSTRSKSRGLNLGLLLFRRG